MTTNEVTKFDFESLTLDEVEQIELIAGTSIDQLMDTGAPKGKALKAIIFVIKKRQDPSFTLEMAGKIPLKDAQDAFLGESDPKE
jgi:hypothetical protein